MIKKYFALSLISASLLAVGCSSDDDDEGDMGGGTTGATTGGGQVTASVLPDGAEYMASAETTLNLLELASSVDDLSTLVSTVANNCDDLAAALADADARLTVFAPSNAAFADAAVTAALAVDDVDVCDVVAGHVINNSVASATDLSSQVGTSFTTLAGTTVAIAQADDGGLTIGGAGVVGADNFATNGVAHVIDTVLLPASAGGSDGGEPGGEDGGEPGGDDGGETTGGGTGAGGGELGASLTAVQTAGNTEFVQLWQTASLGLALDDNAWTVFAPSNDGIDDGVFATVNADQASAFNLLNGHIITSGALDSDALDALSTVTVNNGTEYAVGNDDGVITVNGLSVTQIGITGNATVYSIDGVLQ